MIDGCESRDRETGESEEGEVRESYGVVWHVSSRRQLSESLDALELFEGAQAIE